MEIVYETERLIMKVLDQSHAHQVLDYYLRNRSFLQEWEPLRDEEFYTLDYQIRQLRSDVRSMWNGQLLRLWLFKKNDNLYRTIGTIALNNIIRGAFLSCHLGYKLDKNEVNRGYMTEALKKGIDIAFREYKLHRIEANIMPENRPSLQVVRKLGFYEEGVAYRYLKINGRWEDHIHMVLLNDDLEK